MSIGNVVQTNFDFKVFPNPSTTGNIQLEWNNLESNELNAQLFDVTGKLVVEQDLASNPNTLNSQNMDLSHLTSGSYYLKLETEGKLGTEKIIIQK